MLSLNLFSFIVLSIAVQCSARAFTPPTALILFSHHLNKRQEIPDSAVPDACKSQCSDLISLTNSCDPLGVTEKANCFCESDYLDAYSSCLPCIETSTPNALGGSSASDLIESLKASCSDLADLQSFVSDASLTATASDSSSPSASADDLVATSSAVASVSKAATSVLASASAKVASATAAVASSTSTTRAATGAGTRRIGGGGGKVTLAFSTLGGLAMVGAMFVLA